MPLECSFRIDPGLVVVVDDVESNRIVAAAYLERLGWRTMAYASAALVLEFLRAGVLPAGLLVDMRMPQMSGEELAQALRAAPALRGIRLVAYTAHCLPHEIARFRAGGFDEVLLKPVQMADMARAFPPPTQSDSTH